MSLTFVAQSFARNPPPLGIAAVEGSPNLMLATYDLNEVGYEAREWFISGEATSYQQDIPLAADGVWNLTAAATAPFKTRVVVARPSDPARFNGTVLVEWLNVSAGQDIGAAWMIEHREMLRKGYAWVGISVQKVGIYGGGHRAGGTPLKKADPIRYGELAHPGDAFSFDIFSQAGRALKTPGNLMLGGLVPQHMLAIGMSQSAVFLTTYVNGIHPLDRIYDGYFLHSRFGTSAALDGTWRDGHAAPAYVRVRTDLTAPVLSLITETDLLGAPGVTGYIGARQPDSDYLRVWEVAGSAHADNYIMAGAFLDSGKQDIAELAKVFRLPDPSLANPQPTAINPGMSHHYVAQAALAALDSWVRTGRAPTSTTDMVLDSDNQDDVSRDAHGNAVGGVRTPWTDVPAARLSGRVDPNLPAPMLTGPASSLSKAELAALYPGGKADYLCRFTVSLDAAIAAGHILSEDREEILKIAAINFISLQ